MKLYEINAEILRLTDAIEFDEETGEILGDADELLTQIHSLHMEKKSILEYLAKLILKANSKARKQAAAESRTIVYICSPYTGDTASNILAAQKYCKYAVDKGYLPFAAHLFFPQFLNDENPAERSLGLAFGNVFMDMCAEIWIFGSEYSAGMQAEYDRAARKGYKIRCFTSDCREIEGRGNGGGDGAV